MNRAALPLALLAVVALTFAVAPGGASPQPSPICGYCGETFERAADDRGVNATVATSRVTVQVHENGSATWTVRNRLTNGSDQFGDDRSRLTDVARSLAASSRGVGDDASFVSAELEGDTTVLVYRDSDAAERHAGLLVVDYLHDDGYDRWYVVNADAFTIRSPDGTVVTNDPGSGQVDGRAVTWEGNARGPRFDAPSVSGSPYVVFGPDRSMETSVRTTAAVLLASAPVIVRSARSFLLLQTPAFAVALTIVVVFLRARQFDVSVESLAAVLAGLGVLSGVGLATVHGPEWVPGPAVFSVCVGGLAVHSRTHRYLRTPRRQGLATAGALVITWATLVGVFAGWGVYDDPALAAFKWTALAFPFAAMVPLGGALDAERRRILWWGGATVVAFATVPVVVVNFADPPSGLGSGLVTLAFLGAAVLFPVVGALVVVLGRQLSDVRPPKRPAASRPEDL